jgi:hypothetical protein
MENPNQAKDKLKAEMFIKIAQAQANSI